MVPMPGLDYAGTYLPLVASKETAIAHQNPLDGGDPRLFSDLITALSYVLDVQEDPRLYHAWRVAAVSAAMAEQIIPDQATDVFYAALLHDVGGMGAFSHIVRYPTLYSQKSQPGILAHPQRGRDIVRRIPGMELSADLIADHHEWYSGVGYPAQKKADEIPIGAQLIRIADSADMSRQFTPQSSLDQTIHIASVLAGIEVSNDVAEVFRMVISREEFHRELVDEGKLHVLIQRMESAISAPILRPNSDTIGTVLTVFARAVDARHGFTAGHSEQVAGYAVDLATAMGLSHCEVTKARFSGLLHDAGKVAVPRSIIDKPGPLGPNEIVRVRHHPVLTMDILRNIAHLSELAWIAGHHHERWDGAGYPDGLRGEEIPLLSRILAVADAVDAMTSPRSYKQTRTMHQALEALRDDAGSQFDEQVVDAAHAAWGRSEALLKAA